MSEAYMRKVAPLAERMRPKTLDDVVGQTKALAPNSIIRNAVSSGNVPSIIFWGPPGCGKTTLARIIAESVRADFRELSAVNAGVKDIRDLVSEAEAMARLEQRTILFLDEIHRFNKAQQDALLPHVERGTIILIGATTENPSFEVIPALLSRTTVVLLEPVSKEDIVDVLKKAIKQEFKSKKLNPDAAQAIAELSMGDVRSALSGLETAVNLAKATITKKIALEAMQTAALRHDKKGESHYNLASALIKSMRGSQTDAAMYYLHRLIEGGEDPKFIARRIVIFASEDIGMASPHALTLATSAFLAVERIGMPEANYILSQAVVAMCEAKKSRQVADVMYESKKLVKAYPNAAVPLHLRNAVTSMMKDFGYGESYKWEADFQHDKGFWPEEIDL